VWLPEIAEPIELPGGVKLESLREAIVHLVKPSPHLNAAGRPS